MELLWSSQPLELSQLFAGHGHVRPRRRAAPQLASVGPCERPPTVQGTVGEVCHPLAHSPSAKSMQSSIRTGREMLMMRWKLRG